MSENKNFYKEIKMGENKNEKGFLARNFGRALNDGLLIGAGSAVTAASYTGNVSSAVGYFALATVCGTSGSLTTRYLAERSGEQPKL